MNVTIPEALKDFVEKQASAGHYASSDAFVADVLRAEAAMLRRIGLGEPLPTDEHFDRRVGALLDEAQSSGAYVEVTKEDFDAMEREALELLRNRKSA